MLFRSMVLTICNTQGATLAREADAVLYTHAGPEVAVASTKAFTAQLTVLYLLALQLGKIRNSRSLSELQDVGRDLLKLPSQIAEVLENSKSMVELAKSFKDAKKGTKAKDGDQLIIDFTGKLNGEEFEGGKGEDAALEIGAGRLDRKSTRLNSSHIPLSRMPSSA